MVITLEYCGDVNDEYEVKYVVHSHDNSTECGDTCNTVEMEGLDDVSLSAQFIPIFIASLQQKQSAFLTHFINNKNFAFFSEDFFCRVDFYLNGDAHLSGCLWTFECDILNEKLSSASLEGNKVEVNDFLQYIETSILTSVSTSSIKDCLGVSDEEAIYIQNLAKKHQINLHMAPEHVFMPSYETMYRLKPDPEAEENLDSSKKFLQICKTLLLQLSDEDKISLSTEDWLDNVSKHAKFDVTETNQILVQLDGITMSFCVDERLNKKMSQYSCFEVKLFL